MPKLIDFNCMYRFNWFLIEIQQQQLTPSYFYHARTLRPVAVAYD